MNRIHKSQVREILIQLTDLQDRLKITFWDSGEDMSTLEEIAIKKALAKLKTAISDLTGVI